MAYYICFSKHTLMSTTKTRFRFLLFCMSTGLLLGSCQSKEADPNTAGSENVTPIDSVDPTVFSTTDTISTSAIQKKEFIPATQFGYYRAFTPPSILLDEKGEKTMVNGNPVRVPATVSFIQINSGKVYGVQLAQGQQFLFTGFYDYQEGSNSDKGTLNMVLDGRYLKTGKPVGPWNPQVIYSKIGDEFQFTLIGVSGAPDSKMSFVAPEISTTRMQELMKEEEQKL